MTPVKPISVIKNSDFFDQKTATLSCLSKKELVELHAAPTNYPKLDYGAADSQSLSHTTYNKLLHKSRDGMTRNSFGEMKRKPQELRWEHGNLSSMSKEVSTLKNSNPLISHHNIECQKEEEALHFYEEKNGDEDCGVDLKREETHLNLDELPSPSSLVGGITNLLSHSQSLSEKNSSTFSFDDELSLSSVSAANKSSLESQTTPFLSNYLISVTDIKKESEGKLFDQLNSAIDNQANLSLAHERPILSPSLQDSSHHSEVISADKIDIEKQFNQEHPHETRNQMGEKENEGNSPVMKTLVSRTELTPVTASPASSQAALSKSVATTLRVTHLLDELMAVVSRLRLEGQDGKAMTIQLKNETLADTNVRLVSTGKQLEVSFLTSNPNSHLLLNENKNLLTLQSRLNALCSGQVVTVQTQLTSSSHSSDLGNEQNHSRDDLASFDQGNRGNFSNNEDTL